MAQPSSTPLILASGSEIRAQMLQNAGLTFETIPVRVDEGAIKDSHVAQGGTPRDLADVLAEMKSQKQSVRHPAALVLGADQVLECEGKIFSKPESPADARGQLLALSGQTHRLISAAVVCQNGLPIWRHVGVVRMTMHQLSARFIDDYVARNWESVRHAVGCYKIEEEGVRLFARIEGDFFHIQGLPLIELLTWLRIRGDIDA